MMRALSVAGVTVLLVALTGCATGGGDEVPNEALFAEAKTVNHTFKAAVADVQLRVLDDSWIVNSYGDLPSDCNNDAGYTFYLDRTTPDGWRIGGPAIDAAKDLGAWMGTNGWADVALRTYSEGIESVVITASNPDAFVEEIVIDITPGELMDTAVVTADSTCEPGSQNQLIEALIPGFPLHEIGKTQRPETEHPNDTPIFGFNEDGTPLTSTPGTP